MKNSALQNPQPSVWKEIIHSMGLVFGDIGTSPIYTLPVIFALLPVTVPNVIGIISLIVWTLIILVNVEYAWLAMSLGRKGEGGTIVLKEILVRLLKTGKAVGFVTVLSYVGVSLLIGDGVITPAITILSAVEGMRLIPGFAQMPQTDVMLIAFIIVIFLFLMQSRGTEGVASLFGPVMAVWFLVLTASGVVAILTFPDILKAVSPWYAVSFFREHGTAGFFILSDVILCATGGEALYADMGHLGKRPIIKAWYLVMFALVINYMGQGAYLINHPKESNILFSMVKWEASAIYLPFLLLTISATIIASQALISGMFSIVYQGINTRIMPLMKIIYTSLHLKSQIYIPWVNWSLMCAVLFIIFVFQASERLAMAYGLAVSSTMTITGIMMTMIFARTSRLWQMWIAVFVTLVDVLFLTANLNKLHHGGYWSLVLASFPLMTIFIWTRGNRALYSSLKPLDRDSFLHAYSQIYATGRTLPGTALFLTRDFNNIPPYVVHCILQSNIVYEHNIFVSIVRTDEPFGMETELKRDAGPGLDLFIIRAGYMELIDVEALLRANGIQEKVIFYGVEDIVTSNFVWKIFALIRKIAPNFVQFYRLPANKLHGIITRLDM
ncbi:MAG: KUP/HAK/KT family potassium transporter [Dissulfuribacterales bacterium]